MRMMAHLIFNTVFRNLSKNI
ncbi:hypothetical protein Golob_007025 [Gossypium lobatum]|uniref:Uncharacterized protein n=1 Tax=Gossypium lobatum TaxID=34289 RepID=A0A7J8NJP7_9ROSI|nr:hypothetical protein [Gossypium lobatum]